MIWAKYGIDQHNPGYVILALHVDLAHLLFPREPTDSFLLTNKMDPHSAHRNHMMPATTSPVGRKCSIEDNIDSAVLVGERKTKPDVWTSHHCLHGLEPTLKLELPVVSPARSRSASTQEILEVGLCSLTRHVVAVFLGVKSGGRPHLGRDCKDSAHPPSSRCFSCRAESFRG